jgi:hypothetical protein
MKILNSIHGITGLNYSVHTLTEAALLKYLDIAETINCIL